MNWIDIVWPMMGGASLSLAVTHVLIGMRSPRQPAHFMFALAAGSVATLAIVEMLMMRSTTPAEYGGLLRWAHVSVAAMVVAIVLFLRLHFNAGRLWLAALVCILRVGVLVPNFIDGANANFRVIESLHFAPVWGAGVVAIPIGEPNPWMLVAQLSNILLLAYLVDTVLAIRRRGDPLLTRRAVIVCGSIGLFVAVSAGWAVVMVLHLFDGPWSINIAFFIVVLTMSYELGGDVVRAASLARRLAESQAHLHQSEQRLHLAARAARLGMWTWDIGSQSYWFTDTGQELIGGQAGERLSRDELLALIDPADREAVMAARDEAIEGSGEFVCEFRMLGPETRWLTAIGAAEYSPSGKRHLIRGVLLDITERRQSDQRFRQVIDRAPTAMLVVKDGGQVAFANSLAAQVFGLPHANIAGHDIAALMPSWPSTAWPSAAAAAPLTQPPPVLVGMRADGSAVSLEVGVAPIRIGEESLVVASVTDISERIRMEQESALQRDELAHLSRVALLGELSGSIAHELNQPLTAVLSNAQAALRFMDRDPPNLAEVRDSLVAIVENDKRASDVIRRLRTMLRKELPDFQQLDANEVVNDMLRLINSDLLNRNVKVVRDLQAGLPAVNGDRVQLQQVLLNLIINACDAMGERAKDRILTVRTRLSPEALVVFTISDVGLGIPDEDLERVFEPFMTTKREGIGLGLPICRTIVRAHGGALWATNNDGAGASLHVSLPVHRRAARASAHA